MFFCVYSKCKMVVECGVFCNIVYIIINIFDLVLYYVYSRFLFIKVQSVQGPYYNTVSTKRSFSITVSDYGPEQQSGIGTTKVNLVNIGITHFALHKLSCMYLPVKV